MKNLSQMDFAEISSDYKNFIAKFKPKKTTDDCYTPSNIYAVVLDWASAKYGFDKNNIIRPFYPGGDYEGEKYPDGCVVVDNPPFSILSKIIKFYEATKINYFLFAPALTLFSSGRGMCNYIATSASITYDNGAVVNTSFVTNLGDYVVESAPELSRRIKAENDKNLRAQKKELPKYHYPDAIITSAFVGYLSNHHTHFALKKEDAMFIKTMDAQKGTGKGIFGGGFLLSSRAAAERAAAERAAAERAAAERAAAECFNLSQRERQIQKMLGSARKEQAT